MKKFNIENLNSNYKDEIYKSDLIDKDSLNNLNISKLIEYHQSFITEAEYKINESSIFDKAIVKKKNNKKVKINDHNNIKSYIFDISNDNNQLRKHYKNKYCSEFCDCINKSISEFGTFINQCCSGLCDFISKCCSGFFDYISKFYSKFCDCVSNYSSKLGACINKCCSGDNNNLCKCLSKECCICFIALILIFLIIFLTLFFIPFSSKNLNSDNSNIDDIPRCPNYDSNDTTYLQFVISELEILNKIRNNSGLEKIEIDQELMNLAENVLNNITNIIINKKKNNGDNIEEILLVLLNDYNYTSGTAIKILYNLNKIDLFSSNSIKDFGISILYYNKKYYIYICYSEKLINYSESEKLKSSSYIIHNSHGFIFNTTIDNKICIYEGNEKCFIESYSDIYKCCFITNKVLNNAKKFSCNLIPSLYISIYNNPLLTLIKSEYDGYYNIKTNNLTDNIYGNYWNVKCGNENYTIYNRYSDQEKLFLGSSNHCLNYNDKIEKGEIKNVNKELCFNADLTQPLRNANIICAYFDLSFNLKNGSKIKRQTCSLFNFEAFNSLLDQSRVDDYIWEFFKINNFETYDIFISFPLYIIN